MSSNYGYLNARVRGLRAKLLDETFAQSAIEAGSFEAFVTSLSQTAYAPDLEEARGRREGLPMVDDAIATNVARTTRSLLRMADGRARELLGVLLMRFDAANLKSVARTFHARSARGGGGESDDAVASLAAATLPAGALDAHILERMITAADLPNAAQVLVLKGHPLGPTFRKAVAAYAASGDLFELEVAIDLGYHEVVRERVEEHDVPPAFLRYGQIEIDATNLRTALKVRGRGLEPGRFFVPGGRVVSKDVFVEIASSAPGAALPSLRAPFDALGDGGDLASVEVGVRSVLERYAKGLVHDPLDIGLVTHYLYAKEREAALLRLVARGTFYGVPSDTLRRELGHA
ncbi:V-type ATPase subunit [soil metagenome]|nr:V-type ATPase subunit [Trueperaceae bacterium]